MKKKKAKKKSLDRLDCAIIELLQKDGRLPNTEIAKKIGIAEATVRTRLNKLLKEQIIQIIAVSNPFNLGFEAFGNMKIQVETKKRDKVIKELEGLKGVWFIALTTGATDIYAEFIAETFDELNEMIFDEIVKIDGVIRTDTSLTLKFIKKRYDWGTAWNKKS